MMIEVEKNTGVCVSVLVIRIHSFLFVYIYITWILYGSVHKLFILSNAGRSEGRL
jgi:hypothetical protein